MLKRCCLLAGVALSCSSTERNFALDDQGGAAGQVVNAAQGGHPSGGRSGAAGSAGAQSSSAGAQSSSAGAQSSSAGAQSSSAGAQSSSAGAQSSSAGAQSSSAGAQGDGMAGAAGKDVSGAGGLAGTSGGNGGTAGVSLSAGSGGAPNCAGCLIGSSCIQAGAQKTGNPCEICDVSRSRAAYSSNLGALCGAAATVCSAQDACDANGVCQKNDLESGTPCSGGACDVGVCQVKPNPFDCIAPTPPKADFNAQVFELTGTPPSPKGGVPADGRYTAARIDLYNSATTGVDIRAFEIKKGYVQISSQYYNLENKAAYIPEVRFTGSFVIGAGVLKFTLERCDPQYDIGVPDLPYTATANGMVTILALKDGTTVVTSYLRQ